MQKGSRLEPAASRSGVFPAISEPFRPFLMISLSRERRRRRSDAGWAPRVAGAGPPGGPHRVTAGCGVSLAFRLRGAVGGESSYRPSASVAFSAMGPGQRGPRSGPLWGSGPVPGARRALPGTPLHEFGTGDAGSIEPPDRLRGLNGAAPGGFAAAYGPLGTVGGGPLPAVVPASSRRLPDPRAGVKHRGHVDCPLRPTVTDA